jgi:hypothetical protein
MPIEYAPPPVERPLNLRYRLSYAEFLAGVRNANGRWLSLPLTEVTGPTKGSKQSKILLGARVRGFRVQTTIQAGRLYARLRQVASSEVNPEDRLLNS